MMHNILSDFEDCSYPEQALFKKFSILSNLDESACTEEPHKPVAFIPDDSFDAQFDCYSTKLAAQRDWYNRLDSGLNLGQADFPLMQRADSIDLISKPLQPQDFVPPKPKKVGKPVVKKTAKVAIPGRNLCDEPLLVNPKQARRMLIMREKRARKFMQTQTEQMLAVIDPAQLKKSFGRFTKVRVKDQVRSRVAFARKRENGLFVSKHRELELAGTLRDDSDTDDPD
jgi:hypothetical protein